MIPLIDVAAIPPAPVRATNVLLAAEVDASNPSTWSTFKESTLTDEATIKGGADVVADSITSALRLT